MKIGIIGAGAIANFLLESLNNSEQDSLQITSLYVRNKTKYDHLSKKYGVELFEDINEFLSSPINIVVEAATVSTVQELLPIILEKHDVILSSIGALAEQNFYENIYNLAEINDRHIYLPSGAIGGLDLVQSAQALGEIKTVSITTRKPAKSFSMTKADQEIVIYKGSAAVAIQKFPKNINVAIILSLAGIGVQATTVEIIADPQIEKNKHTIKIEGSFGTSEITVTNEPMESNPNTSYLAALSVLNTLKNQANRIKIGG